MKVGTGAEALAFKENEDLYKRMNKSIERKIENKEQEIKNLDTLYDKKIEIARVEGEDQYIQTLDRNNQRMIGDSSVYEDKIKGYQDKLKQVQNTVAKEELNLKTSEKQKLTDLKAQLEENFEEQYSNTQENQRAIAESTQAAVKEITAKSKSEKTILEGNAQYEINALASGFNQKAADSEKDFRTKLDSDVRIHNAEVNTQKEELKKLMTMDMEKNKRLSNEQNRVNQDQLTYQENHQKDMLAQREKDFKVRYENMVKEHDTVLKSLSAKFEADSQRVTASTSTEKKILNDKSTDPFYRVDKLNPKLTEDLKTVTVSVPVAEYEKENIHLSTQGRSVKITLSRKYTDSLNAEDGSINRSTRSELFSKELNTVDLLSPKNITQNYSDGILTFKINKA
jgi:HSP20 family molecular chaperone IbpA